MKKMQNKISQKKYIKGISSSKQFWNFVKPLLPNKVWMSNDFISIRNRDTFIGTESKLVEMFSSYYCNMFEKTSGVPTENYIIDTNNTREIIEGVIRKYERHSRILKIKNNFVSSMAFDFPKAEVADIDAILKKTDPKKATGPDTISPKLVKMPANVIDKHLYNINMDNENYNVPDNTEVAAVRPISKKKSRNELENYRLVSLLNAFSITPFNHFFSIFISAYRKSYSSSHVLIRLIENWKQSLDNQQFVGGVLMDLSKAFDCIPHDLLIGKINAYGFSIESLKIFFSY